MRIHWWRNNIRPVVSKRFLFAAIVSTVSLSALGQTEFRKDQLADGVERWYAAAAEDSKPVYLRIFQKLYGAVVNRPPFGKTIAFLTGIRHYDNLPDLPLVHDDIDRMREFLLSSGNADTVYVATDRSVTASLIRRFMIDRFRLTIGTQDRLIFYYSGHADDLDGTTGYLQLASAKSDVFSQQTVPVSDVMEWSSVIPARHILFILDACSAGLAFQPKSGSNSEGLLKTLSGEGSRTVITAGRGGQKTYDGWFTRALLKSLEDNHTDHFLTIHRVFAGLELEVAHLAQQHKKEITPQILGLDSRSGTFVFLNPNQVTTPFARELRPLLTAKGGEQSLVAAIQDDAHDAKQRMQKAKDRGNDEAKSLQDWQAGVRHEAAGDSAYDVGTAVSLMFAAESYRHAELSFSDAVRYLRDRDALPIEIMTGLGRLLKERIEKGDLGGVRQLWLSLPDEDARALQTAVFKYEISEVSLTWGDTWRFEGERIVTDVHLEIDYRQRGKLERLKHAYTWTLERRDRGWVVVDHTIREKALEKL